MNELALNRLHIHDMKNSRADVLIRQKQLRDYSLHWHDCFEIELVLSGTAAHTLNGVTYTLQPGDVYLLRPTDFHSVQLSGPVTVYNLMFSETRIHHDMLEQILDQENNLAAQLSAVDFKDLSSLMRQALREFEEDRPYRDTCLQHLLECIFIHVLRFCAPRVPESTVDRKSVV